MLEEASHNKWVDPSDFKTFEEFHKGYSEAYGRAKSFDELITLFNNSSTRAIDISKRLKKVLDEEKDNSK